MILFLSPQLRPDALELHREGAALTINRQTFDFADLAEGERRDVDCPWVVGPIWREAGLPHLTLILPHDEDAPEETRFPAPLALSADGPVTLPPRGAPAEGGEPD